MHFARRRAALRRSVARPFLRLVPTMALLGAVGIALHGETLGAQTFREARLYRSEEGNSWLVVQHNDGRVARYAFDAQAVAALSQSVNAGLLAVGQSRERLVGSRGAGATGVELSQPAGNLFTTAVLGGVGLTAVSSGGLDSRTAYGAAAGGVVMGALLADRIFVRTKDRTSADSALTQLGGIAGALIGAGFAAMSDFEERGVAVLAASGGLLGLLATASSLVPLPTPGRCAE